MKKEKEEDYLLYAIESSGLTRIEENKSEEARRVHSGDEVNRLFNNILNSFIGQSKYDIFPKYIIVYFCQRHQNIRQISQSAWKLWDSLKYYTNTLAEVKLFWKFINCVYKLEEIKIYLRAKKILVKQLFGDQEVNYKKMSHKQIIQSVQMVIIMEKLFKTDEFLINMGLSYSLDQISEAFLQMDQKNMTANVFLSKVVMIYSDVKRILKQRLEQMEGYLQERTERSRKKVIAKGKGLKEDFYKIGEILENVNLDIHHKKVNEIYQEKQNYNPEGESSAHQLISSLPISDSPNRYEQKVEISYSPKGHIQTHKPNFPTPFLMNGSPIINGGENINIGIEEENIFECKGDIPMVLQNRGNNQMNMKNLLQKNIRLEGENEGLRAHDKYLSNKVKELEREIARGDKYRKELCHRIEELSDNVEILRIQNNTANTVSNVSRSRTLPLLGSSVDPMVNTSMPQIHENHTHISAFPILDTSIQTYTKDPSPNKSTTSQILALSGGYTGTKPKFGRYNQKFKAPGGNLLITKPNSPTLQEDIELSGIKEVKTHWRELESNTKLSLDPDDHYEEKCSSPDISRISHTGGASPNTAHNMLATGLRNLAYGISSSPGLDRTRYDFMQLYDLYKVVEYDPELTLPPPLSAEIQITRALTLRLTTNALAITYTTLANLNSEDDRILSFIKGDKIIACNDIDGWTFGFNQSDQKLFGFSPLSYLQQDDI